MSAMDQQKFSVNTQLELAKSLIKNLKSQSDYSLLPSDIGLNSGNVNDLVMIYNEKVLDRNKLLSGATEKNPLVIEISDQLKDLKQNINFSINNYLANLETSIGEFDQYSISTSNQTSQIPTLEAKLLEFKRKFQLAENLYLFLLQRREEASISYESTLPNTAIINDAYTEPIPVAPKPHIIYLACIMLGLLVPFGIIYILKLFDTAIHSREQLETMLPNVSILGEVPFVEDISSVMDSRSIFAESSRVIRSNISFKFNSNADDSKIILSTSTTKGEGKTLNAFNMAVSYLATGKKVILIGADLRNPQLHNLVELDRKSDNKGISTIIATNNINQFNEHIIPFDVIDKKLDIILSGPIPPNPAELLSSQSFSDLLALLKETYDIVLIDTAPLMLVSDSLPLLKLADLVLYTVRAHYTDKRILPFINDLIEEKNVKSIGLILNGIKAGATSYYKYGYGYRYSYKYNYNYGYGYGYTAEES
jgi:capsular exopolysaccharide synthesis family protein